MNDTLTSPSSPNTSRRSRQLGSASRVCRDRGRRRSGREQQTNLCSPCPTWTENKDAKSFLFWSLQCVSKEWFLPGKQGSPTWTDVLDVDRRQLPQTQTGDVGTSICPSAPPEISGADAKLSISVSECGLILGRHCEMAEDLDHRAGRSAHTGRSWSINHGPLVRPWSAGATTSPSIHTAALRVLMLEMLRSACSAPPAVMAWSRPAS